MFQLYFRNFFHSLRTVYCIIYQKLASGTSWQWCKFAPFSVFKRKEIMTNFGALGLYFRADLKLSCLRESNAPIHYLLSLSSRWSCSLEKWVNTEKFNCSKKKNWGLLGCFLFGDLELSYFVWVVILFRAKSLEISSPFQNATILLNPKWVFGPSFRYALLVEETTIFVKQGQISVKLQ